MHTENFVKKFATNPHSCMKKMNYGMA